MDDEIVDFFQFQSKPFVGVETREDIIMSLPFATASIDDIRDDILTPNIDGYWKTLEEMHQGFVEEMKEKRLMTPLSLAKRNHSWLNQYPSLIKSLGDCLAVHGQSHFMGQGGLINLSQEKGWKWFLFKKGTYLPFTYAPENMVTPILYH